MTTLFYTGRNEENLSQVSWKVYRINRTGSTVTASWGPAYLVKRRVRAKSILQSKTRRFVSEAAAKDFMSARKLAKLKEGYELAPRRRRPPRRARGARRSALLR